ncbi:uncharacterized protein LOC107841254 [Capsicum annuum]|uniref:uncharacterized protein LOC107841254 n=1 Tax=Capsicum annuum TaxID=4072 RepID=UPI0007BF64D2|nr:uncharacterized protein LOC107841254 [Capsicum annuum]
MAIEQHQANGVISLIQCDSFKDKLLSKTCSINKSYDYKMGKRPIGANEDNDSIDLSEKDKARIYRPWQFSSENMLKVLHGGPWFVTGYFLSVRQWEPNFAPHEVTQTLMAIWLRLSLLPTEFYDQTILDRIGSKLGTLLKIDTCVSSTLRGRYARTCILVPLDVPLKIQMTIGSHQQRVFYEGEGILCTRCGRLGHIITNCIHGKPIITMENGPFETTPAQNSPDENE